MVKFIEFHADQDLVENVEMNAAFRNSLLHHCSSATEEVGINFTLRSVRVIPTSHSPACVLQTDLRAPNNSDHMVKGLHHTS